MVEIKKPIVALLSNYEVLSLLKKSKEDDRNQKQFNRNQNLATICYETRQYLEQTPCKHQSPEIINGLMEAVKRFNLTKSDKLQILNLRPVDEVGIQLIVDESEERLSQDDVNNLIDVITNLLKDDQTDEIQNQL